MNDLGLRIRRNAWPIGIALVILSYFTLDGALVYTAFRDKATAPEENYYDKAIHFDQLKASTFRSNEAGWTAQVVVAQAPLAAMPRRVDVIVHDGSGKPVVGRKGKAMREIVHPAPTRRPIDARRYGDQWVAIWRREVVDADANLERLLERLKSRGLAGKAGLLHVPPPGVRIA